MRTMRSQTEAAEQTLHSEIEPGLPQVRSTETGFAKYSWISLQTPMSTAARGPIEVNAARRNGGVEMAVSDNGPGMAEDQVEHIFERFTRGDAG